MEVMTMCWKLVALLLTLAAIGSTALGYWQYLGTRTYVDSPDGDEAPDGTWYWWWDAYATIYGAPREVSADGWAAGGTGIDLTPDRALQADVFAWSVGIGESDYAWIEDLTSKAITVNMYFYVRDIRLTYWGEAIDRTWTCDAVCSTGCYGTAYGGITTGYYRSASGTAQGRARTLGGTFAYNLYDLPPYANSFYYWQGTRYGYFYGWLRCSGSISSGPRSFSDEDLEGIDYFTVSAAVQGASGSNGRLTINDPEFYWGSATAQSEYYINAYSEVTLSGNIR